VIINTGTNHVNRASENQAAIWSILCWEMLI
jgi:hypothetical protein